MTRHVAVVGAGIVGLSVADTLLSRGFRVTIVDRDHQLGNGCSYGNGGMIVPSHFVPLAAPGMVGMGFRMMLDRHSPFGIESIADLQTIGWLARFIRSANAAHVERSGALLRDLHLASRLLYERIFEEMGDDVGYRRRGLLMLSRTKRSHDAEVKLAVEARRLGLEAEVLTRQDLARLEPDLQMDVAGAVHFANDAHFSPRPFMHAYRARVLAKGAEIRQGGEVKAFRRRDNRIEAFATKEDEISADEFVLAAGAWSGELAASLKLRMPMLAGKGYGLTVANPCQRPSIPAILTEARVAVTPMLDGVRFVGVLELCHPTLVQNRRRLEGMRRSIPAYYPAFQPEDLDVDAWCGLRPCSPDGLPYLGRTRCAENLVIASGHAMMGMSLGPITGKIVSELIAGETASHPLDLMSPDRYA